MRDAFGGAFSVKLMLIFLMLYVSFMCVALSYARAFRVKNRIINIIEQYEGYVVGQTEEIEEEIDKYLKKAGYNISDTDVVRADGKRISSCDALEGRGYCIVPMSNNPTYYKVETYMVFKIPILNVKFPISIEGETKRIETVD